VIYLSGGLDSATLLYCLGEYVTQENIDLKIYAITIPNKFDTACGHFASLVIQFVSRRFPKLQIEHIIKSISRGGNFKSSEGLKIVEKLHSEGKIQGWIEGVTKNPDDSFEFIEPDKFYITRIPERDKNMTKSKIIDSNLVRLRPFANINKKGVCEITEQKKIKTKLLMITKSCTDAKQYKCNTCWWCQERNWGFSIPVGQQGRL
jgi:tRNA(Ile)-lysidine synthase TilS/MesJ